MAHDWLAQLRGPNYTLALPLETPATESEIEALQACAPRPLPDNYLAFLRRYGGGEIWYRDIWLIRVIPPSAVPSYHEGYGFAKDMPGSMTFGGNGGGEGLVFDMRAHHSDGQYPILAVNYITIGWDEQLLHVANSFRELVLLRHELLVGASRED
jgi:hypothetical protein